MSLAYVEITRANIRVVLGLAVKADQVNQVASNAITIAEAAHEPATWLRAIAHEDSFVGLIAMIDPARAEGDLHSPPVPENAACLWRFMIDAEAQGRGFGAEALEKAKQVAREWGYGGLSLTTEPGEGGSVPFYRKYGFAETGRVVGTEVEMLWRG